jgi:hypothetical protein
MELKDVVSVAGVGGLHKIVGQRPSGLILETLDEQKRRFPTSLTQKVSILEDIAIFTTTDEIRLSNVLLLIKEKEDGGLTVPERKADENTLRGFMADVLPDYDKERVYASDIKKLVGWYNILKDKLDFEALKNSDEEGDEESIDEKPKAEAKPKKETKPKVAKKPTAKVNTKNTGAKQTAMPRKTGGS